MYFAILFSFVGFSTMADDQVIPAPQPQYTIVTTRSASCTRYDSSCVNSIRNQAVDDAFVASHNYCEKTFSNDTTVIDWKADCNSFMMAKTQQMYPQPPQPPDFPKSIMCTARVDFVCGL